MEEGGERDEEDREKREETRQSVLFSNVAEASYAPRRRRPRFRT